MDRRTFHIIPYSDSYSQRSSAFERGIVQGKQLQLEICKAHFLDRARVFEKHASFLALSLQDEIVGLCSGAETKLTINGTTHRAGIGFDTKVAPNWRGMGIAKKLAQTTLQEFFKPNDLQKNFSTVKYTNKAVFKIFTDILDYTDFYEFVYLTLPTHLKLKAFHGAGKAIQRFQVDLFDKDRLGTEYHVAFESSLGYFRTDRMFQLKIKKISPLFKAGINVLSRIRPEKYLFAPREGDVFSYATLFNHQPDNLQFLQEVLDDLALKGIRHLMVCCQKGDPTHRWLKKYAIDEYKYVLLCDFELKPSDRVTIDARCL